MNYSYVLIETCVHLYFICRTNSEAQLVSTSLKMAPTGVPKHVGRN